MKKLIEAFRGVTFADLSKYRSEVMGFAIIQVMLLHFFQMYNDHHNDFLSLLGECFIRATASVGVEFFIIMSGVGLYYSLSKNNSPGQFFKKRFSRVVIPYIMWGSLIFIIYSLMKPKWNLPLDYLYHFFFGSLLFKGLLTFWYVPFVLITYLLAPLVFKGISGKRPFLSLLCWLAGTFAVTALLKFFVPTIYGNTYIAIHRFPMFFVGMYFGRLAKENRPVTPLMYIPMLIGLLIRLIKIIPFTRPYISFMSRYYIVSAFSFFALFVLIVFFRLIKECFLTKSLRTVGKYSYELYITHQGLRRICYPINFPQWTIWGYGLIVAISIAASLLLSRLTDLITGKKKLKK